MKKAFTLVELLIVIAILSILGVGLLIALDPLEQTRRATDTTVQQSAIEIKDAINRYYASKLFFPWCDSTTANPGTCTYEGTVTGTSSCNGDDIQRSFGASGTCGEYVLNQLVTTGELKSTPPSNISTQLNLVTNASGLGYMVTFQPVSKAFDSNLTNLYEEADCLTQATTATCAPSGNNCYYCLK